MKSGRMRKTLFALVLTFTQCVSGAVNPFRVIKGLNETSIVHRHQSQVNSSNLDNSNKIEERDIFEDGNNKPNNLSERSFIWINTRYKSALRSKIYSTKVDDYRLGSIYPYKKFENQAMLSLSKRKYPPPPSVSLANRHPSNHLSPPPTFHHPTLSIPQSFPTSPSPLSPPILPRPLSPPILPRLYSPQNPIPPLFRPHHDIKIPCTMSNKNSDKQTLNKCKQEFSKPHVYEKFRKELPKIVPYLNNYVTDIKPEIIMKPYSPNEEPKNPPHILNSIIRSKAPETYGFPGLFQIHRSAFSTNELLNELSENGEMNLPLDGNLNEESNFVLSPVEGSDEDKLLERYIKHTLADNGVRLFDDLYMKCKECNGKSDPNCKCGTEAPKTKIKLFQILETKNNHLETTIGSRDKMNDYDDSSNDETFSNKTIVDLFTLSKINDMNH